MTNTNMSPTTAYHATIPDRMRAVILTRHGGPEALEVRDDIPVPVPGADDVIVAVSAAGMNNTDVWSREGAYGTADDPAATAGWRGVPLDFPRIQGGDIAGRIIAVGSAVDAQRIGQRVLVDCAIYDGPGPDANAIGLLGSERDGGFAEYVVVEASRAHDVTDSELLDTSLAALPIAYGTAAGMLARAELTPGESVFVTGASGGVGLAAVQLATARGCAVYASTSRAKRDAVLAAGATAVVERDQTPLTTLDTTVDVVVDVVGGGGFHRLVDTLSEGGRLAVAGAIAGAHVSLDIRRLYLHSRRIVGSAMWTPAHFEELVATVRAGGLRPVVRTYPSRTSIALRPTSPTRASSESLFSPLGRQRKVAEDERARTSRASLL